MGMPRETHNTSRWRGRGPEGEAALELSLEGHKESALGGGRRRDDQPKPRNKGEEVIREWRVGEQVCFPGLPSVGAASLTLRVIHPDPGESTVGSTEVAEVGSGEVPQLT